MKNKISVIFKENYKQLLLVFLAFFIMILVSYIYVSEIVREQMETIGVETMNTTQASVSGTLKESERIFENSVNIVDIMLASDSSNEQILNYLHSANSDLDTMGTSLPDFLKIYAYIRDEFLDGSGWEPPADYFPPSRPWHIGALANAGEMYFSEPYLDADTGGMCISFSKEVYDANGIPQGVVAIDLDLSRITEHVANQQIAAGGYGVLMSDTMQITTHKNEAYIGMYMDEVSATYAELADSIETSSSGQALRFTDYDGTDSVAFFSHVFNGWHIVSITPWSSYYSQVYNMGVVILLLGLVLAVLLSGVLVSSRMAKIRADEESRSKSNFLARMSHEMRTPMNAIIGMTEIARGTDDPKKIQHSLAQISDAANHLLGVINDVLDMSKIEAGKLELSPSDFTIDSLKSKIHNVMDMRLDEKKQLFTIEIDPELPEAIVTDEQRLNQVIINLLSNANKFTPVGGHIDLRIDCLEKTASDCLIKVSVSDDGIGMSEEQIKRLFKSFEQADNSISRRFGGTGLGLAISKNIVEALSGEIAVSSVLDEGSVFNFTIRVGIGSAIPEPGDAEAGQKQSIDGIFVGKHIMIAEDVEVNREIVLTLLEPTGVLIDYAENGRIAVELFEKVPERYDLIFMDIHMPEMDGYEATGKIREMDVPQAKTVPIVAMTADVFREDVVRAENAGMNGHVGKPIDMDEVIGVMKKYLL